MKKALIWTHVLSEPLFTLYSFIPFLLYKNFGASAFHIALLTMLRPVMTILSFYWSQRGQASSRNLRSNLLWAGIWMRIPFLLCPWVQSLEFMIFASVNYMFFYRAANPALLEMIRQNIPNTERSFVFSFASAIGYLEGVAISLGVGFMLDQDPENFQGLFFIAAVLGLVAVLAQSEIKLPYFVTPTKKESFKDLILKPWKESLELLKEKKDFFKFQKGFMGAGFGIMLIQPALPIFAVDFLGVSYLEIFSALSIAKGLGFVLSSLSWSKLLTKTNIFHTSSLIFILFALFPITLSMALFHISWLYIAYFLYGIAQGGSHLVWNLSGPHFSKADSSLNYTAVGVVLAGLRGAVAPPLGSALLLGAPMVVVLALGGAFCFISSLFFLMKDPAIEKTSI